MKTCHSCQSLCFDDMDMCYDCMSPFEAEIKEGEDSCGAVARFKVILADLFSYELLLQKLEGRALSVGSASTNAIVIPQEEVAEHQLDVFFAQGYIWAENVSSSSEVLLNEVPLKKAVCIEPGNQICVGTATITVLE